MIRSLASLAVGSVLLVCGCSNGGQSALAPSQAEVTFQVRVPATTPAGDTIYLAGDFNGWTPDSAQHALVEVAPLTHALTLSFPVGTHVEFKFTRGSWASIEKGAGGFELPNRTLEVTGPVQLDLTVAAWADLPP